MKPLPPRIKRSPTPFPHPKHFRSTYFRRTRDTAAPTASVHDLSSIASDAEAPAEAFAERLRRAHATGTVLVVGHSNTVPGIVSALCGCEVVPIDESDY